MAALELPPVLEWAATYGNLASVIGLAVTLLGFTLTLWVAFRAKSAAEKAKSAAEEVRKNLLRFDIASEITAAIATMEELKKLHRQDISTWETIPDRYATLRRSLVRINAANIELTDEERKLIQDAVTHFRRMDEIIEKSIQSNEKPKNVARMNKVISLQIDNLSMILVAMRDRNSTGTNG